MNYKTLCIYIEKLQDLRHETKLHFLAAKKVEAGKMSKEQIKYLFPNMPESSLVISKARQRLRDFNGKIKALEKKAIKMYNEMVYGERA